MTQARIISAREEFIKQTASVTGPHGTCLAAFSKFIFVDGFRKVRIRSHSCAHTETHVHTLFFLRLQQHYVTIHRARARKGADRHLSQVARQVVRMGPGRTVRWWWLPCIAGGSGVSATLEGVADPTKRSRMTQSTRLAMC